MDDSLLIILIISSFFHFQKHSRISEYCADQKTTGSLVQIQHSLIIIYYYKVLTSNNNVTQNLP